MCVFKRNRMFGTKHSKTYPLQKTNEYKTNEQSRLQDIRIKKCKYKYNKIRLVLGFFVSTCLY